MLLNPQHLEGHVRVPNGERTKKRTVTLASANGAACTDTCTLRLQSLCVGLITAKTKTGSKVWGIQPKTRPPQPFNELFSIKAEYLKVMLKSLKEIIITLYTHV